MLWDATDVSRDGTKSGNECPGSVAGELGFEPRLTESESGVLPLHYSPEFGPIWPAGQGPFMNCQLRLPYVEVADGSRPDRFGRRRPKIQRRNRDRFEIANWTAARQIDDRLVRNLE